MNTHPTLLRLASLIALVLALFAAWLLLFPGKLPTPRMVRQQADPWVLSPSASVESDTALSVIMQSKLWGGGASNSPLSGDDKALTPPDWRIAGVYVEAKTPVVLVAMDGVPTPLQLRVGDKLPGGARILSISTDRVCFSLDGKRVSLSTYPK